MDHKLEYKVALSFAGEQRDYVEQVSQELSKLGIHHFYDNNETVEMWGKALTEYLDEIYFYKSEYVVVFVSREYRDKIWTRWEIKSAQDRSLRQKNEYILPVYFDRIRLSGLPDSIGYINGNRTSPKELARMIYEKVMKSKVESPQKVLPVYQGIKVSHQLLLHQDKLTRLNKLFENLDCAKAVVILGEKGIGKRTLIDSFLDKRTNVLHISPRQGTHYQYEPIIDALGEHQSLFSNIDDLLLPERIKKQIFNICNSSQYILYLEGADSYEENLISYLFDICNDILTHYYNSKTLIILEYNCDGKNAALLEDFLLNLPSAHVESMYISRISNSILENYVRDIVDVVDQDDLDYILHVSNGNLMYLNALLNYLKLKGIIANIDSKSICSHIEKGSLTDVLGEFIRQRYYRLDDQLKDVLSKSAVIGNTFSSALLKSPFGIIQAEELLLKIETVSQLISRETDSLFSFESEESYKIISSEIRQQERSQWHRILAKYYERLLKYSDSGSTLPLDQEIVYLSSASRHFEYAGNYEDVIRISCDLAKKYYEISDFQRALQVVGKARDMMLILDTETTFDEIEYNLSIIGAKCLRDIGHYAEAASAFMRCITNSKCIVEGNELALIKLDCALCLYMDGKTTDAIRLAERTKDELYLVDKESLLTCKALSLLSSFYDSTGNQKEKRHYYIQAITICRAKKYEQEYYHMLKNASMVYDEAIARQMYPAAEQHFEKTHQIKSLAELKHNMATDSIILDQPENVLEPMRISQELFASFGSVMIHYPLNTQGIHEAVFCKDYQQAINTFQIALSYKIECYSQIVLRANISMCFCALGDYENARMQLEEINSLVERPENSDVFDYEVYRRISWGIYYFHIKKNEDAIKILNDCISLPKVESRYLYLCKAFIRKAKNRSRVKFKRSWESSPKPILDRYIEQNTCLFTLRFYE